MVKQDFSPSAVMCPGSPGPYEKAFTDATGKYGNEIMVSVPWSNARNPRAVTLIDRFEQEYPGQRFELNVGFSFEAAEIVADAVVRAKSNEAAAIHAALKTTDIADHVMSGGPIQFDAKGQNVNIGIVMLQNQAGKPVVVAPADVAVGKPVYPITPFDKR
jgi:branched-chain amino acid transport system substrate-binding protein